MPMTREQKIQQRELNELRELQKFLKRLQNVTRGCRQDMHEPDEQDVTAGVSGQHLDNSFGDDPGSNTSEFVVTLSQGRKIEHFNLATLIAVARLADLDKLIKGARR